MKMPLIPSAATCEGLMSVRMPALTVVCSHIALSFLSGVGDGHIAKCQVS
jgi:hypothetical protein